MAVDVTISVVNNGWVCRTYDPDFEEDDTTSEVSVFTNKRKMLQWLSSIYEKHEEEIKTNASDKTNKSDA